MSSRKGWSEARNAALSTDVTHGLSTLAQSRCPASRSSARARDVVDTRLVRERDREVEQSDVKQVPVRWS